MNSTFVLRGDERGDRYSTSVDRRRNVLDEAAVALACAIARIDLNQKFFLLIR